MNNQNTNTPAPRHVLVTGGAGFLGRAVIELLQERGDRVRSFQRGDAPDLAARGVEIIRGDIRDRYAVCNAVDGVDVVIHTAAKAGVWGDYVEYHAINVEGTDHVIAACRHAPLVTSPPRHLACHLKIYRALMTR